LGPRVSLRARTQGRRRAPRRRPQRSSRRANDDGLVPGPRRERGVELLQHPRHADGGDEQPPGLRDAGSEQCGEHGAPHRGHPRARGGEDHGGPGLRDVPDDDVQAAAHGAHRVLRARLPPRDLREPDAHRRAVGGEHPQVLPALREREPHRHHGDVLLGGPQVHVQEDDEEVAALRDDLLPRHARRRRRPRAPQGRAHLRAPDAVRRALRGDLVQRVLPAQGPLVHRPVLQAVALLAVPRRAQPRGGVAPRRLVVWFF
ncbi:hypothetical protein AURANDRAFT_36126, partial [Aureococcus anophagefferens]